MPSMPSQNLDPSNVHLKAAGQRLQDARLAQDISVDTVMRELRVTRLQIAGIESGNPKSFYNESFFIDLLKRYARLLNFSEAAIAKMVSPPVVEEVVSPASPASTPAPAPGPAQAAEERVQEQLPESIQVHAQEPVESIPPKEVVLAHHEAQTAAPKSSSRVVGLMGLVVLAGAGVALGLQMTQSTDPTPVATTTIAIEPATPTAFEAPAVLPSAVLNAPAGSTASEPAAGAAPPALVEPSPPKPEAAKSEKPAQPKPSPESASAEPDQAPAKTIVDTPMTLTAKQKSWIWVRDASDQVRQFGVAQGQTVKFDQLPIFIVVHDPTVFEVIIGNKVVPLVRNNDERNVARHTRTDLINFYKP